MGWVLNRRATSWRFGCALIAWVVCGLGASTTTAQEPPTAAPEVTVYTIGAGDDLFSNFGHAAMCVRQPGAEDARCFNYGTADFTQPLSLSWSVLRGHAQFWVSKPMEKRMQRAYMREDRSMDVQRLNLPPKALRNLAAALYRDGTPKHKYFIYKHFSENCATKLRDHLNTVTHGKLAQETQNTLHTETLRQSVRRGFAGNIGLLIASDLFLGRRLDQPMTVWEAMFLPEVLHASINRVYNTPATRIYTRKAPPPQNTPNPNAGVFFAWWVALGLLVVCGVCLRWPTTRSVPLWVFSIGAGTLGLLLTFGALVSPQPEIWKNEALLLFWPLDLLTCKLPPQHRRVYLSTRLACLIAWIIAATTTTFIQPLWPYAAWLAACLIPALWSARHTQHLTNDTNPPPHQSPQ